MTLLHADSSVPRLPAPVLPALTLCAALAAVAALGLLPFRAVRGPAPSPPATSAARPFAPALGPDAALAALRAAPGLEVARAAAEPLVIAPVAGAFDEDGRLWVVEMPSFMRDLDGAGELEPTNRIVVLTDRDGDGTFDDRSVFLDGLRLPRGVAPCRGGALVIEPPDLLFCRDADGDGRADERRVLLSGFAGLDNPEHAGNSLWFGADAVWHVAQHDWDFRFDGARAEPIATPVVGQWGIAEDDGGRLVTAPNSAAPLLDLFPKSYAARNPHHAGLAGIGLSIAASFAVRPLAPDVAVNRGYLDGTLRQDGTLASFTAACGPLVVASGALGEDARGDVLVCEPAGHLIKRFRVEWRDGAPAASDAYREGELLASADPRFRPVHLAHGPDGAVYVFDFARGVIQHRLFVTPYLRDRVKERGLESPLDQGRIWRLAAARAPSAARPALARASAEELAALLEHADAWWRATAERLLVERGDRAVAPRLREVLARAESPNSRLRALWTLSALGAAEERDLRAALADRAGDVRAAALRVAEERTVRGGGDFSAEIARALDDPDRTVRLHAAATCRDLDALAGALQRHGGDAVFRSAALCNLADREGAVLDRLLAERDWPANAGGRAVLGALADAELRAGAPARGANVARIARMGTAGDPRAELLFERLAAALDLAAAVPRALDLAAAPVEFERAAGGADREAWRRALTFLDWPGRPAVERPRPLRPLLPAERALFERGERVYSLCIGCHGGDGSGAPGQGPPLARSARVAGADAVYVRIAMFGMQGRYAANGATYSGLMPAAAVSNDRDLAAVLTYVRRSFGNTGEPVDEVAVRRVRAEVGQRKQPFSDAELDALR